ncbi:MAG TPA: helicase [Lachnospiraceae bacterium]|nr:helicase [Lachnospiraceae bacterium]
MERELYQWQEECLKRWFAHRGKGIVQAVTGSGKTLLALEGAGQLDRKLKGRLLVRIVVPTGTLLQQWNRAVKEFLADSSCDEEAGKASQVKPGKVGLRGCGYKDPANCKYMIYVINSARYELARQILAEIRRGESVLLIADECHRYESGQNRLIFEFLPYIKPHEGQFYSLGLTATLPSGEAGQYLTGVLGRRIYSYGMAEASSRQTVCPFEIYHIALSFQWGERAEYEEMSERMLYLYRQLLQAYPVLEKINQKERYELLGRIAGGRNRKLAEAASQYRSLSYRRKSLVCQAQARTACAVSLIERLETEEKILVFGERIAQAEELYSLLRERYPGRVGRYHSRMGQQANKNVLERFRDGELRILIACKAVDEGLDVPDASVGIILSGTSTQRQRVQRLGRILRKKEGDRGASLYYLHVTETSEDICFLPNGGEKRLFELEYDYETGAFRHPDYDCLAEAVLDRLLEEGAPEETLQEAMRCLRLGSVRPDWTLPADEIGRRIRAAKRVAERNYWICMKRMRAATNVLY